MVERRVGSNLGNVSPIPQKQPTVCANPQQPTIRKKCIDLGSNRDVKCPMDCAIYKAEQAHVAGAYPVSSIWTGHQGRLHKIGKVRSTRNADEFAVIVGNRTIRKRSEHCMSVGRNAHLGNSDFRNLECVRKVLEVPMAKTKEN